MFIDEAKIFVQAGKGGNGCVSFRREKYVPRGGPDGGDGGNGGNIVLVAASSIKTLLDFQQYPHYHAQNGENGKGKNRFGKTAPDLILNVPVGTTVYKNSKIIADLVKNGQRVIIAKGGKRGKGNRKFKTRSNKAPRIAEEGIPGQRDTLILQLKLIADIGLIGYPNAGKSTLLSRISNARPKIANYPFTTLVPNLGIVKLNVDSDMDSFVVADIPGLIAGAHQGKGLGHRFLRHIERTKLLIHLIDIAGYQDETLEKTHISLNRELKAYSSELAAKEQIVVVNKIDLPDGKQNLRRFRSKTGKRVYPISALTGEGIDKLLHIIARRLRMIYEKETRCN